MPALVLWRQQRDGQQSLPWPNALAPVDDAQHAARSDSKFSLTSPGHCRLLPIAREGILRAEVSPHEQEAEIQKLMARPFKGRPAN